MIKLLAIDMDGTWLPHQLTDQNSPVSLCHLLKRSKGHRLSHAKDALPVRNSKADCSFFVKCLSKREAWYHCAYQTWVSAAGTQPCFFWDVWFMEKMPEKSVMSKIWNRQSRSFHVMWKNCSFTFFQKLHAAAQNASCKLPVSSCCLHRSVCRDLFIRTLQRGALTHLAQSLGIAKSEIAWHQGLRKWSEYVWGFRNEVCHWQCRWDSEKRSRSYASGLRS